MRSLVIADAEVIAAPPVRAVGDDGLTAQPPAVIPVVIVVWPPTASEKEAVTYEPVVKVVVLMVEVVAMIEPAVIEMAFAPSMADTGTNGAGRMGTTAPTAHMATTPGAGVGYSRGVGAAAVTAASMGSSAATAAATVAAATAATAASAAASASGQL